MPIRAIDMQVMMPKTTEIQKIKSVEAEMPKNNVDINLHKDQQQNERNMKQVKQTPKTFEPKINKEQNKKQQKNKQDNKGNDNQKEESETNKPKTKIDIRL